MRTFHARYDGTCEVCGFAFDCGDPVTYTLDDVLVHDYCADEPDHPDQLDITELIRDTA